MTHGAFVHLTIITQQFIEIITSTLQVKLQMSKLSVKIS